MSTRGGTTRPRLGTGGFSAMTGVVSADNSAARSDFLRPRRLGLAAGVVYADAPYSTFTLKSLSPALVRTALELTTDGVRLSSASDSLSV